MYINEKLKVMWHGGDYNPDQWLDYPEVLEKDIELMKKSGCLTTGFFLMRSVKRKNKFHNLLCKFIPYKLP